METLAEKITEKLINNKIISETDKEIYSYGFWQGMIFIINTISVIIIGLIFGMLWQCLVFTIAYGCLRMYAGGYHARTQKACYVLSILLITAALLCIRFIPWNSVLYAVTLVFSATVIFVLAPVEDENKPLDEMEQKVYKNRTRIIFLLLSAVSVAVFFFGYLEIAVWVAVSILAAAVMVVIGKVRNNVVG